MTQVEKTRKAWPYTEGLYTFPDQSTRQAAPLEDCVRFNGKLIYETSRAFFVGFGEERGWVPKSQASEVQFNGRTHTISMTIPQWLAEDLGFE